MSAFNTPSDALVVTGNVVPFNEICQGECQCVFLDVYPVFAKFTNGAVNCPKAMLRVVGHNVRWARENWSSKGPEEATPEEIRLWNEIHKTYPVLVSMVASFEMSNPAMLKFVKALNAELETMIDSTRLSDNQGQTGPQDIIAASKSSPENVTADQSGPQSAIPEQSVNVEPAGNVEVWAGDALGLSDDDAEQEIEEDPLDFLEPKDREMYTALVYKIALLRLWADNIAKSGTTFLDPYRALASNDFPLDRSEIICLQKVLTMLLESLIKEADQEGQFRTGISILTDKVGVEEDMAGDKEQAAKIIDCFDQLFYQHVQILRGPAKAQYTALKLGDYIQEMYEHSSSVPSESRDAAGDKGECREGEESQRSSANVKGDRA